MAVHQQHSAALNHRIITALHIEQLHSSTMVATTAISHIYECDILCPRRDIPSGTFQTGHPRWDVLFQMSRSGRPTWDMIQNSMLHMGRPVQDMMSRLGRPVWSICPILLLPLRTYQTSFYFDENQHRVKTDHYAETVGAEILKNVWGIFYSICNIFSDFFAEKQIFFKQFDGFFS